MRFNPELDIPAITNSYVPEKRARIENVWPSDMAGQFANALSQQTAFNHAYTLEGKNFEPSDQEVAGLSEEQKQQLFNALYAQASKGIGFFYGRHLIETRDDTPALLKQAFEYLNSESVLQMMRDITGHQDINKASAQATRYVPGNFLTRHNDVVGSEGRRVAYVMAFTPNWHPDWGGLLQFFEPTGAPRDSWAPMFNSMTLFDVTHVHSVTYVTPFAGMARYSITGWFKAG